MKLLPCFILLLSVHLAFAAHELADLVTPDQESESPLAESIKELNDDVIKRPNKPATPPAANPSEAKASSAGNYSGFLSSPNGERLLGYFTKIKVSAAGKFSARMYYGNSVYALKGKLENGGFSDVIIPKRRGSGSSLAIADLQLVKTVGGAYKIEGTVKKGGQTAVVVAVKSGVVKTQAGAYTLLIPAAEGESSAPQGHGYGLMRVTSSGTAKIKGLLGDGSKWTVKCLVSSDGEMPLYVPLYQNTGSSLSGLVRFRNVAGVSDCDGKVIWQKSGRFNLRRYLVGSRYSYTGSRLLAGILTRIPNVMLHVGAGSGFAADSWGFVWTAANKIEHAGRKKIRVKVSTRNGRITGKFPQDRTQFKMTGVVFQKQRMAAGMVGGKGGNPRSLVIVPVE